MVLAGSPLRAPPATLLARSRLVVALAGRLALVGAVGSPLLGLDALDGRADPLPVVPLGWIVGFGAQRPHRIGDAVGGSVLLDLTRGLAPSPPAPGRLRHRTQGLQDIAEAVSFRGHAAGPSLPGQSPDHLPILGAEVSVGLQPAGAAVLVLTQLPLPVIRPVDLLGGHRQATRDPGRLLAAS